MNPDELIAAYLDDALTAEQHARLTEWLRADPENLRRFVAANIGEEQLRSAVQAQAQLQSLQSPSARRGGARVRVLTFPRTVRGWAAAAAVVLIAAVLSWRFALPPGVPAEVVAASDARLADHAADVQPGVQLSLRTLRLESGSVRLRLRNGVLLDIAGPAEATFKDPMRLRVAHGRFTADVGARGKGFTIETATARIVDLGTRFGIDASAAGETDVVVFDGQVEIHQRAARRQRARDTLIARLDAGEAVRLDDANAARRIVFVVQGWEAADWNTRSEPPPGAVIKHVTDNLAAADSRRFYRVSTGGMSAGARARNAQRVHWFPYEGDKLPAWLEGADLVETFGVDKWEEEFALTVTLARPALLCVFQDSRVPAPAWLRTDFVNTGYQLQIRRLPGDERVPGQPPVADVPFDVWTREIRTPGEVTLGPPRSAVAGDRGRMYGVAARALTAP